MKTPQVLKDALEFLVSDIPTSDLGPDDAPAEKAVSLTRMAALKAAGISGAASAAPGPAGLLTILPDLKLVWTIQQRLVADIAAVYGKTSMLSTDAMVFCLFRHGGVGLASDLLVRSGTRIMVRQLSTAARKGLLERIGIRVTQRMAGKGLARWVPIAGILVSGGYAYYDTSQVGATAVELFGKAEQAEAEHSPAPLPEPGGDAEKPAKKRRPARESRPARKPAAAARPKRAPAKRARKK